MDKQREHAKLLMEEYSPYFGKKYVRHNSSGYSDDDYIDIVGPHSDDSLLVVRSYTGDDGKLVKIKDTMPYKLFDKLLRSNSITEVLEKLDESDGEKDGEFSVHNIDCYDGNHDDNVSINVIADAIRRGPGYIPHYDEDGNKIDESMLKSAEDLADTKGGHTSDLEGEESKDKPRKKIDYLSDSGLKNIINNVSARPGM